MNAKAFASDDDVFDCLQFEVCLSIGVLESQSLLGVEDSFESLFAVTFYSTRTSSFGVFQLLSWKLIARDSQNKPLFNIQHDAVLLTQDV